MKIDRISFKNALSMPPIELRSINLFVGNTGTGKSYSLNQIFALGQSAVNNALHPGDWDVDISVENKKYNWRLSVQTSADGNNEVFEETLKLTSGGKEAELIRRDKYGFEFNGARIPTLSRNQASIYLLREEPEIKQLYQGFSKIMRRDFAHKALDDIQSLDTIKKRVLSALTKTNDLEQLFKFQMSINSKLYVLKERFPQKYNSVVSEFKAVFPFITEIAFKSIRDFNIPNPFNDNIQVLAIKEKNVNSFVPIFNYSSGMKKVLLILTDIIILPKGGIYLIDEYENSLGVNAINFFPDFLSQYADDNQIIITSHHPYIINKIPVENWFLFQRNGMQIHIKAGKELVDTYSRSKQDAFVQLMNDPFYLQGIE